MRSNLLDSRRGRLVVFSLLYLSEGIPFGFTSVALAALFRQQGMGLAQIGAFTAALYAPWAFKWAWAPLVDLIRPKRFGPSRTWIVLAQSMMILSLAAMLLFDLSTKVQILTLLAIVHNTFAATSDVAIDGLAVRVIPKDELGTANGFMFGSQYFGIALGGSGALGVAAFLGFPGAFAFCLVAMVLLLVFVSLPLREPADAEDLTAAANAADPVFRRLSGILTSFLKEVYVGLFRSGRGPMVGVLFALLPMGAMALSLSTFTTMQVDLGMAEGRIAVLTFVANICAAVGSLLGGFLSDRWGHRRCLAVWYTLSAAPTLWLASRFTGLGMEGITVGILTLAAVTYYFAFGLQYGTKNAIYMSLTNPKVAGTQFTAYMALNNLVYTYSSLWQNPLAAESGYGSMLNLDGMVAFLPLLLIPFLVPARRSEPPSNRHSGPPVPAKATAAKAAAAEAALPDPA